MVKPVIVGAHYGFRDWLAQRVTAVVMALYTVIIAICVLTMPDGSYESWRGVFSGGFMKSFLFAVIVVTVSCYKGYFAHMRNDGVGPEAVSNATTSAVVMSCVLTLVGDYVLTSFLL